MRLRRPRIGPQSAPEASGSTPRAQRVLQRSARAVNLTHHRCGSPKGSDELDGTRMLPMPAQPSRRGSSCQAPRSAVASRANPSPPVRVLGSLRTDRRPPGHPRRGLHGSSASPLAPLQLESRVSRQLRVADDCYRGDSPAYTGAAQATCGPLEPSSPIRRLMERCSTESEGGGERLDSRDVHWT
jgi:hypothetical protein